MTVFIEALAVGYIVWKLEEMDKNLSKIKLWIELNFPDDV